MFRLVATLYIVCFGLFVWFSRQPDYFDGEFSSATIHYAADSTGQIQPMALYAVGKDQYRVNAHYLLRRLREGQHVQVIYDTQNPERGTVYSWWGYWFTWEEIVISVLLLSGLYQLAVEVIKRPTEESLLEEAEMGKKEYKRKYKD